MPVNGNPARRGGGDGAPRQAPLATLVSREGPFPPADGLAFFEAVLGEVAALHRFNRPHGALGPDNVFLDTGPHGELEARLGLADRTGGAWGDGPVAPERRAGELPTMESDVWALGALAFSIFAGRQPTWGPNGALEPLALLVPQLPIRLGSIVGRMLGAEPDLRPTVDEALYAVRTLREAWGRSVEDEPDEPEMTDDARDRGPSRWLGKLLGRRPEPSSARAPAPRPPAARPPGGASLALLCVEDFAPIPRATPPAASDLALQTAIDETLSAGLRVQDLPAFPSVALEVVALAKQDEVGSGELVRVINRDQVLTAAVLRMANSAFANRGIEVASVRDAVTRLGLREIANVAAAAATRTLFEAEGGRGDRLIAEAGRRLWLHAVASGLSASWLAMECGADDQRAFLGGLLHDIGKTLALRGFARVLEAGVLRGIDAASVIGTALEATHVELGRRLARSWRLPEHVQRACAEHHQPQCGPQTDRELYLVRIVSGMAALRLDPAWTLDHLRETQESAAVLGFDRFRLRATAAEVRVFVARAEALTRAAD